MSPEKRRWIQWVAVLAALVLGDVIFTGLGYPPTRVIGWTVGVVVGLMMFAVCVFFLPAAAGVLGTFFYSYFLKVRLRAMHINRIRDKRLMREASERSAERSSDQPEE